MNIAKALDQLDELHSFKQRFIHPLQANGAPYIYFCGNSLGLQPKAAKKAIEKQLENWATRGVKGHFQGETPWTSYHEPLAEKMAQIVGAKPSEVTIMNTLTVNLHLMLVSFYRPTAQRYKILIESDAFPSDKYAVLSQIDWHQKSGLNIDSSALIELRPREGEVCLRMEDIEAAIATEGDEIALILLGNPNYYTGQVLDMKRIAQWGHAKGCIVGFDCAHGAGNIPLNLKDSGVDFAVWCTYKYLNCGPGSLSGCFVHERHATKTDLPRLAGWWGHNKAIGFQMRDAFDPIPGAEGWQLSNPPILAMASMYAALDLFLEAGMDQLFQKSTKLTNYLAYLLQELDNDKISIITPNDPKQRGCQLSMAVKGVDKSLYEKISQAGIICDWREPAVIRLAPTPLYNSFEEVARFVEVLEELI